MLAKRSSMQIRMLKTLLKSRKTAPNCSIFDVSNSKEFECKVKHAKKPILVNFHASWCMPCKALTPRLTHIITAQRGNLQLARVDVDECTDLALNFNVSTVPSIFVMYKGKILNRMEGLQASENIRKWLAAVLKENAPDCIFMEL